MTYDKSNDETGCCPPFLTEPWQETEHVWKDKNFITDKVRCFMHIPLGIGKVILKNWNLILEHKADVEPFFTLSEDPSPWRSNIFFQTKKEILGAKNVTISGTFISKVFEGPYKDTPKWMKEMEEYVKSKGKSINRMLTWFTTCPKCAKHYGKNYVVIFAKVD